MGASRIRLALSLLALTLLAAGCRSLPAAGTGDVAFRLLWQGESDLDLHVEDPSGVRLLLRLGELTEKRRSYYCMTQEDS